MLAISVSIVYQERYQISKSLIW